MKLSLPSNPSVEHLKKQAKALHKSCREGRPDARHLFSEHHPRYASGVEAPEKVTLQEAQLVLARQYGFSSWPDLIESLKKAPTATPVNPAGILLYTNGGTAIDVLNSAKVPGQKLEWIEALHDGPVPLTDTREELYRIRADHFASLGWTSAEGALERFNKRDRPLSHPSEYTGLQLWFEHDLFDQLQLIQLLDWVGDIPGWSTKAVLYQFETFLGRLRPHQIEEKRPTPIPVTEVHFNLAKKAWRSFRDKSPQGIRDIAGEETTALPFLGSAFLRLCQEYPSIGTGLSRTETQILSAVADGKRSPQEIFHHNQELEDAQFMGDSSFFALVQRLSHGSRPLLRTESGDPFRTPAEIGYTEAFRVQKITLTGMGQRVIHGEADWLLNHPGPFLIGGVRIAGPEAPRWDQSTAEFRFGPT